MESTPKTSWSQNRKLKEKMKQICEEKLTKSDFDLPAMDGAHPKPTISKTPGELFEAPFGSLQYTDEEYEAEASTRSLIIALKGQSKSASCIGMYLEILNDNLLCCVLFYLDNFLSFFNITLHALYYQFSVVTHTSLYRNFSFYIPCDLDQK